MTLQDCSVRIDEFRDKLVAMEQRHADEFSAWRKLRSHERRDARRDVARRVLADYAEIESQMHLIQLELLNAISARLMEGAREIAAQVEEYSRELCKGITIEFSAAKSAIEPNAVYTLAETCQLVRGGRTTLWRLEKRRKLLPIPEMRHKHYSGEAILRFIQGREPLP
jgi:hypothetical protein